MDSPDFKTLLQKYNTGNCTAQEKEQIEAWYSQLEPTRKLELTNEQIDGILAMQIPVKIKKQNKPVWKWVSVAAAVLIIFATGTYISFKRQHATTPATANVKTDAEPGSDKAILTLATGKKIVLNTAMAGILASEMDATIHKTADGQVVYNANTTVENSNAVLFNTMSTPRGGQYHLTLADGTQVWLNAFSSITYPTRFVGSERKVEISGEVYFEVAHRDNQPFHVFSKGQRLEVLGTHFNINAYSDEPVTKTTLLQGSVKVSDMSSDASRTIKPGEQTILSARGMKTLDVDLDQAIAWHNGDFVFSSQSVEEMMRMVSRWYDVDIDYHNYKPSNQTFTGVVSRAKKLSAVINMIKKSNPTLKFDIHGNTVSLSN